MKQTNNFISVLSILAIIILSIPLNAQVTIGSSEKAIQGALLDLKEYAPAADNTTSTKGLLLPRVKLTVPNDLDDLLTPEQKLADPDYKLNHTGLWVYNTEKCDGYFSDGLYLWDGDKWRPALKMLDYAIPGISLNGLNQNVMIDIPSGLDARGATIPLQELSVSWTPKEAEVTIASRSDSYGGGVVVASGNPISSWSSPLSSNPTIYSFQPANMSNIADIATNPWQTRETQVVFTIPSNKCGGEVMRTVSLNQTNYAISLIESSVSNFTDFSVAPLYNTVNKNITVKGNTIWKVTVEDPKGILESATPVTGGADNKKGSTNSTFFYYKAKAAGSNTRYAEAKMRFEDTYSPKRFADIVVTAMSCIGSEGMPDVSSVPQAPANIASWGTQVLKHQDQDGNDFYSASFGAAGRWMTTNLAAKQYDPVRTDGNAVPPAMTNSLAESFTSPYWTYPNPSTTDAGDATSYNQNKHLGLLYNNSAATGSLNISQSTEESAVNIAKRQGICPAGWHLPSDYEWTMFENEIQRSTSKYSSTPDIGGTLTLPGGIFTAPTVFSMLDICQNSTSTSNSLNRGGFSALLAGYAQRGGTASFGSGFSFHASSRVAYSNRTYGVSYSSYSGAGGILSRTAYVNVVSMSVRCKKD
ncbi:FISUMP domain-containing protein [Dysgonomonas sp. ZJ279]|uniref:FISUMP domain-containing protein n=1 Tax=Dysgonomonas sp. ZJ279 TaxID=2709796 RepID=UPI0013ED913A|nr:FISUMP domain-containing protein [Dysgonomonas sp. ZJ279]